MPARLFCKTGDLSGLAYFIDREATIGRLDENHIALSPSYISGHHARIYFDAAEGRYFLEDLNSSNGTRLDGSRITEPTRLDRLHVITFAKKVDFIFHVMAKASSASFALSSQEKPAQDDAREKTHIGDVFAPLPKLSDTDVDDPGDVTRLHDPFAAMKPTVDPQDSTEKTAFRDAFTPLSSLPVPPAQSEKTAFRDAFTPLPSLPIPPPQDESPSLPQPSDTPVQFMLVVTMPDRTVKTFSLQPGEQVIGRDMSSDLTVPDPSISRRHAKLTVKAGTVTLTDLDSKNATFVDGKKLETTVEIHPHNAVRFGLSTEASLKRL